VRGNCIWRRKNAARFLRHYGCAGLDCTSSIMLKKARETSQSENLALVLSIMDWPHQPCEQFGHMPQDRFGVELRAVAVGNAHPAHFGCVEDTSRNHAYDFGCAARRGSLLRRRAPSPSGGLVLLTPNRGTCSGATRYASRWDACLHSLELALRQYRGAATGTVCPASRGGVWRQFHHTRDRAIPTPGSPSRSSRGACCRRAGRPSCQAPPRHAQP
jgi:hypothetical protein